MLSPQNIIALKGKRTLSMLTAYDYPTAKIISQAGIDMILVGDSLGMVVLGFKDTKSVTIEDIIRHTAAVVRGSGDSLVIADMPIHTTDTVEMALKNCTMVLSKTGAHAVKIEGQADVVEALCKAGIAVMGHTGLKPQTAKKYVLKGKGSEEGQKIYDEAVALAMAGAFAVVLECIPSSLALSITKKIGVPSIGIGAGNSCDGQVLVISDMVGLFDDFKPRFVRRYANIAPVIAKAVQQFKIDVESGMFPSQEESF